MSKIPSAFLTRPIAHRGLHDRSRNVVENSATAFQAAIRHGYGIELDLQLSADGQAMVFHDYDLARLTPASGPVRQRSAAELAKIGLRDSTDRIQTLPQVLELIGGQVPVLIEIKDQDGALGPDVGPLERATLDALAAYRGAAAVMSFNPHSIHEIARLSPNTPRGLVTCDFAAADWGLVPGARLDKLRGIPDYDACGASFISHDVNDLHAPRVAELKSRGARILCWTVRSPEQDAQARRVADNVTFEGYLAEPATA